MACRLISKSVSQPNKWRQKSKIIIIACQNGHMNIVFIPISNPWEQFHNKIEADGWWLMADENTLYTVHAFENLIDREITAIMYYSRSMWGWTELLWASICPNKLKQVANCVLELIAIVRSETSVITNTRLKLVCTVFFCCFFSLPPFFHTLNIQHSTTCYKYVLAIFFSKTIFKSIIYILCSVMWKIMNYFSFAIRLKFYDRKKTCRRNAFTSDLVFGINMNFVEFSACCLTISFFMILCAGVAMHMGFWNFPDFFFFFFFNFSLSFYATSHLPLSPAKLHKQWI